MRCLLITRQDLTETNDLFRQACRDRDLPISEISAGNMGPAALARSERRLIYCAATDHASRLLEKLLLRPGDAALHDPHFPCDHQAIFLRQSGLPMAQAVYVPDVDVLSQQAAWLGGFPVVVKRPGTEGGQGVSLAHTLEDLSRQVSAPDGLGAMLEAFVPHQRCWRLTVLGGEVLAASASVAAEGDFRTNAAGGHVDRSAHLPADAEAIATRAVRSLRLDFGGVDLMEGDDGTLTIAEVNFPCYFADQQTSLGIDIAGAIVDHLIAKAREGGCSS